MDAALLFWTGLLDAVFALGWSTWSFHRMGPQYVTLGPTDGTVKIQGERAVLSLRASYTTRRSRNRKWLTNLRTTGHPIFRTVMLVENSPPATAESRPPGSPVTCLVFSAYSARLNTLGFPNIFTNRGVQETRPETEWTGLTLLHWQELHSASGLPSYAIALWY